MALRDLLRLRLGKSHDYDSLVELFLAKRTKSGGENYSWFATPAEASVTAVDNLRTGWPQVGDAASDCTEIERLKSLLDTAFRQTPRW